MKIFPFRDCYKKNWKLKLNRERNRLVLNTDNYEVRDIVVDTDVLKDGSSTLVIWNQLLYSAYPLFNFREICQSLGVTASEFCHTFHVIGIMQVDKCGGDAFVKVFMPKGQLTLESDTDDYSTSLYRTPKDIHALDIAFSYSVEALKAIQTGEYITIILNFHKSDFWKRAVYISHSGQYNKLNEGVNMVSFKYNPTEDAYVGEKNTRYKGRVIPLKGLLHDT